MAAIGDDAVGHREARDIPDLDESERGIAAPVAEPAVLKGPRCAGAERYVEPGASIGRSRQTIVVRVPWLAGSVVIEAGNRDAIRRRPIHAQGAIDGQGVVGVAVI